MGSKISKHLSAFDIPTFTYIGKSQIAIKKIIGQ